MVGPKKSEEQRLNSLLQNYLKEPADERPTDERISDLTVLALITEIVTSLLRLAHLLQDGHSLRSPETRAEALSVMRAVRRGTRRIEQAISGMRSSGR